VKLLDWENLISDTWSNLIGRPRLTLKGQVCGNITCGKNNYFKLYKENTYICQCGYIIAGQFEIIKYPLKLYCRTKNCHNKKAKMDKECLKCQFIRER
jgi:hypothetical protein